MSSVTNSWCPDLKVSNASVDKSVRPQEAGYALRLPDYFPSTIHRVMNPKESNKHNARLSMPVFIHPSDKIVLSEKYTAKSYLEERLKEIGLKQ